MKTAVEWLVEELKWVYESDYLDKLVEQAKEMEKKQIIKAVYYNTNALSHSDLSAGEEYYNETFKSK